MRDIIFKESHVYFVTLLSTTSKLFTAKCREEENTSYGKILSANEEVGLVFLNRINFLKILGFKEEIIPKLFLNILKSIVTVKAF